MKKVTINLTIKVVMTMDDDVDVDEVLGELDYNIMDTTTKADIQDTEITDWEAVDSR